MESGIFKMFKLAILTSHPIQYQTPLFKKLGSLPDFEIKVYFCWSFNKDGIVFDNEFGKKIRWDIPLFDGYRYGFLRNYSPKPSSGFWGQINPSIISELNSEKYDAILIFGWNSFTNLLTFIKEIRRNIHVLWHSENHLNQEFNKNPLKRKLKDLILKKLFKRISGFLYIGKENKSFYEYYGVPIEKQFFCPYSVDNDRFVAESLKLRAKRNKLRSNEGIAVDKTVILFSGKLTDKKRPLDLLKAYEKVRNPKKALVFVGDGPLLGSLQSYVKEKKLEDVHFFGFNNQFELPYYYALSDIFVLPSGFGETWGLVVNEAMCFALPVIISDVVGCGPDLVREGKNGFIFQCGNIDQLAERFEALVSDERKRTELGKNSLELVRGYSYDEDIKAILRGCSIITE